MVKVGVDEMVRIRVEAVASGLTEETEVYMQLSTLHTVDPVKGLLIY